MCCIPCFPFTDAELEDEPRPKHPAFHYAWDGQAWVLRQVVSIAFIHSSLVFFALPTEL